MHKSTTALAVVALLAFAGPLTAADQKVDPKAQVAALERQCEAEREARIKPLRDSEVAKCKEQGKEPAYCERFWSDYGNATRLPNGKMRPRMFDDLPVCEAARKAWLKLKNEG